MKMVTKTLNQYVNSFIYSLGITIAIYISIDELHRFGNMKTFIIFTGIIFTILLLENIIAVLKRNSKIEINFDINDDVNELSHFFYKFILPFLYYISLIAFGYFNLYSSSITFILVITFFTFLLLFINTKAFFQGIKTLESRTHYVYDLIKFLIFYALSNTFAHIQSSDNSTLITTTVGVTIVSSILILLMIWRINKFSVLSILQSILSSSVLGIIFFILSSLAIFSPAQISLGLFFAFYLSVAIIHHVLLNTLTRSVIAEYIIILLVVFAVVYGIT
jgi:hypothetical protein